MNILTCSVCCHLSACPASALERRAWGRLSGPAWGWGWRGAGWGCRTPRWSSWSVSAGELDPARAATSGGNECSRLAGQQPDNREGQCCHGAQSLLSQDVIIYHGGRAECREHGQAARHRDLVNTERGTRGCEGKNTEFKVCPRCVRERDVWTLDFELLCDQPEKTCSPEKLAIIQWGNMQSFS